MSGKYGLIIANTEYTDPGLAQLTAPGKDAKEFWRVLNSPDIGAFDDVILLFNADSSTVNERIESFFLERKTDDLILLYFSGHGVKDESGLLYLAVKNTKRDRLRSTAINSAFIRDIMDQSRSKRQVLILDCCNSGAFAQGTKAATGVSIGTATAFGAGYGHIVLTASDSTQYAWEGDKVIGGETENSLFTHFLVKGLEGEADNDGDGRVTVDELYDYVYEKVKLATPKQTPSKFSTKQQGEILLRQSMRIEDVKPVPLPSDLIDEIEDKRTYVREAAVQHLIKLLNGKNLGLARSAREALERIAENDDSRTISRAAFQALEAIKQADAKIEGGQLEKLEAERKVEAERLITKKAEEERLAKAKLAAEQLAEEKRRADAAEKERKAREEAERLAAQKAEEERIAKAQLETERKAEEEAERIAAQKAEKDRVAKTQAETERKVKEEATYITAQKAEEERIEKTKLAVENPSEEKRIPQVNKIVEKLANFKTENMQKAKLQPTIEPSNKSPFGALVLSFILFGGVGQIYLGQWKKGIAFIVTSILTVSIGIGALTWLYGAIDAYAMAQKMKNGHSVREWEFGFSWKGALIAVILAVAAFALLYLSLIMLYGY